MPLDRRALRVAAGVAIVVALAAPPVARATDHPRPSARELWRTYPLSPTAKATASAAKATATPRRRAAPPSAAPRPGRTSWLPVGLVALAIAAAAVVWARRRRPARPETAAAPVARPPEAGAAATAALWRRRPDGSTPVLSWSPRKPPRVREWPWPADVDGRWRCEIALAPAALSAQVEAVVHAPGEAARTVLAASPAGPGGPDWQSSEALDEAVAALAEELEAHGWAPVAGGRPHTRRLCWPHAGDPFARAREAAWTA
jgi:hypothetical protein